jgi:sulfur-carrier protein adenylyltransferase/sulfurtransferase
LPALEAAVVGRMLTVDFRTMRFSGFSFKEASDDRRGFRFIAHEQVTTDDLTVELRGLHEVPTPAFTSSLRIDVEQVESVLRDLPRSTRVVLCCRTGLRAWRAASRLRAAGHEKLALFAAGD